MTAERSRAHECVLTVLMCLKCLYHQLATTRIDDHCLSVVAIALWPL